MSKKDATPVITPAEDFDYLSEAPAPDFGEVEIGGKKFKTIQILSEDHKTRRGTDAQNGAFAVRTSELTVSGIGKVWAVPFASGEKEEMATFANFTGALVGWTDRYTALKGTMPDDTGKTKSHFQPVPLFVSENEISDAINVGAFPVGSELRSSSCIDMFFVLKGDAGRSIYRLRIKNHEILAKAAQAINEARALAQRAKAPVCALWLEWQLAEAIEVGKAPNTAMVNGIELASKEADNAMKATRQEYFGEFNDHGVELPGLKARAEEVKAFLDDPSDPYFIKAAKALRGNAMNRLPQLPAFAHLRLSAPQAQRPAEPIIEGEVTL